MKKLFYVAVALMTTFAINTSCGVNEDTPDITTTLATVVEGTSSIPYYVVFDEGQEAYVTNTDEWSPSFAENRKELRYIVSYEVVSETSSIFDLDIKLMSVTPVATQSGGLKITTPADFTGDNGLQTYQAGASADVCFLSPARDYITLMISFYGINTYNAVPKFSLVLNPDHANSRYKDLYTENDGYLYLELYHDNSEYKGEQEMNTYWSCKMPDVDTIKAQYSGVKILSISHKTMRPEVYTFNFTTEEQQ